MNSVLVHKTKQPNILASPQPQKLCNYFQTFTALYLLLRRQLRSFLSSIQLRSESVAEGFHARKYLAHFRETCWFRPQPLQTCQEHLLWGHPEELFSFPSSGQKAQALENLSEERFGISPALHCAAGVKRYHVLLFERKDSRVPFTSLLPQSWLQNEEGRPILPSSSSSRKATMVAKRRGDGEGKGGVDRERGGEQGQI